MAVFPEGVALAWPIVIEPTWDTLIHTTDSGAEQRRQKSLYPRFNVKFQLRGKSATDAQTIWDFFMARKGAFESFYFFDPAPNMSILTSYDDLFIGTGDGDTEVFDIPGKSTSSQVIYIDGTTQTLTTDYVILTGGGDGNADRVDFVTAPALGTAISCDFSGRLRINCRFAYDSLPKELFATILFNFGIELKGLAGN
jgi:uncharacterized protein (TIGR02217 family)